jgi:SAM-dependent methyltransferase
VLTISGRARITRARWLKAQEYERAFWRRHSDEIADGTAAGLDWYKWRAGRLESLLARALSSTAAIGRVLEVGSGPIGIVNFLEFGDRYAIDPLERFYRQQPELIKLRNAGATYLAGSGEQLPFTDGSIALVIIDNVIDHTFAPGNILREIWRVLQPDGHLYLSVNVHTRWGALLHDVLAALRIDKGHPYTFTSQAIGRLLGRHRFAAIFEQIEDYEDVRRANRRSPRVTDRIKGYTGLSEFQHHVLCRKDVGLRNAECGLRVAG